AAGAILDPLDAEVPGRFGIFRHVGNGWSLHALRRTPGFDSQTAIGSPVRRLKEPGRGRIRVSTIGVGMKDHTPRQTPDDYTARQDPPPPGAATARASFSSMDE